MNKLRIKQKLWEQNPYCLVCDQIISDYTTATLEHVIPLCHGGSNKDYNLAVSHSKCNEIKGSLLYREEWRNKWKEYEKKVQLIIWRTERNDFFIRTLIKECFAGNKVILDSLSKFPPYFEKVEIPTTEYNLVKEQILKLRKEPDLSNLIEESKIVDEGKTKNYWRIIFGLIFFDQYYSNKDVLTFLHAIWRIHSYTPKSKNLILFSYSRAFLEVCETMNPEAYEKFLDLHKKNF